MLTARRLDHVDLTLAEGAADAGFWIKYCQAELVIQDFMVMVIVYVS